MPREIITWLNLLALLLFMHSGRLPAFAARPHHWLMFSLLSAKTRRSFSVKLLSSQSPTCIVAWGSSAAGAELCTCPCGFLEDTQWSIPLGWPGPSEWLPWPWGYWPVPPPYLSILCNLTSNWQYVKNLAKVKVIYIHFSPLTTNPAILS